MNNLKTITFQPLGRRTSISTQSSLLDAAHGCGVDITSICGGVGVCESCRIRLINGTLSELTSEEQALFTPDEIENGYRLACQAYPLDDVIVDVPPESISTPQRLQLEGNDARVEIDPIITTCDLKLTPPQLSDLMSDLSRVSLELENTSGIDDIDYEYVLLSYLSDVLRESNWHVKMAMRNNRAFSIFPISKFHAQSPSLLGLAVDIGTTKLAAYLIDLSSGSIISKTGAMNPQIAFGEDVISRIAYTNSHQSVLVNSATTVSGRKWLQLKVVEVLNNIIDEMITEHNQTAYSISSDQIVDAVIVGNTAMHHIFAGLPVSQLGTSPYVPSVSDALELSARDIGLNINSGAAIYMPPNIAGYVGADHVAMLMASVFDQQKNLVAQSNIKNIIALDIGTNTEISLITPDDHLCCSCASGPAFEGAHILFGMRAASGAIERVQINNDNIRYKTIGDTQPVGICGSGILDAISEMRSANIINQRGAISVAQSPDKPINGQNAFVLVPGENTGHGKDIIITRKDISEIQLAKGAIRTGIEILLDVVGVKASSIDSFIIAGAFGTYIDLHSALNIGMFPDIPIHRFTQIGNAAGTGARLMLLSKSKRNQAEDIAKKIKYIELSDHKDFSTKFSQYIYL